MNISPISLARAGFQSFGGFLGSRIREDLGLPVLQAADKSSSQPVRPPKETGISVNGRCDSCKNLRAIQSRFRERGSSENDTLVDGFRCEQANHDGKQKSEIPNDENQKCRSNLKCRVIGRENVHFYPRRSGALFQPSGHAHRSSYSCLNFYSLT